MIKQVEVNGVIVKYVVVTIHKDLYDQQSNEFYAHGYRIACIAGDNITMYSFEVEDEII